MTYMLSAPVTHIYMLLILIFSTKALISEKFFLKMILHPFSVFKKSEYWRLLTGELVHNDLTHLLINEFMLMFVCGSLERALREQSVYGSWKFLIIMLASSLTGVFYVSFRHRKNFNFSSAGASGVILGCLFSFMIFRPNEVAFYFPVIGGLKNKFIALLYIIGMIWYQRRAKSKLINHELHFFSALGGIISTLSVIPEIL